MLKFLRFWRDKREDNGRLFSDEERSRSAITRVQHAIQRERLDFLRAKLARMKAKHEEMLLEDELADMEEGIYGTESDDGKQENPQAPFNALGAMDEPDALLAQMFMQILSANQPKPAMGGNTQERSQRGERKTLTDDELRAYKEKIPATYLKRAKKMSDEQLIEFVGSYKPEFIAEYDDDTIQRACKILKE